MKDVAVLGCQEARAEVDNVSENEEQDETNKDRHKSFLTTDTQEIPEHWHHCPERARASLISISVNTSQNETSENNSVMNMTGTSIASVTNV